MMINIIINNEHIGIRQFFARQNFPNRDSSKFSTIKILRYTVCVSSVVGKAYNLW